MKRFMPLALLSATAVLVASCSSSPVSLTPEEAHVIVLREAPDCDYKSLGMVSASSGSVGLDIKGNESATLSRLRRETHAVGGNAVILRAGGFTDRPWYSNGEVYQLDGEAIINCS